MRYHGCACEVDGVWWLFDPEGQVRHESKAATSPAALIALVRDWACAPLAARGRRGPRRCGPPSPARAHALNASLTEGIALCRQEAARRAERQRVAAALRARVAARALALPMTRRVLLFGNR